MSNINAGPVSVPEGWRLAPEVATEPMIAAGWIDKEDVSPGEIWAAMIDVAPAPELAAAPPAPAASAAPVTHVYLEAPSADEWVRQALERADSAAPVAGEAIVSKIATLLSQGFMTCSSGGSRDPYVEVRFPQLRLAQDLYGALLDTARATPAPEAEAAAPVQNDAAMAAYWKWRERHNPESPDPDDDMVSFLSGWQAREAAAPEQSFTVHTIDPRSQSKTEMSVADRVLQLKDAPPAEIFESDAELMSYLDEAVAPAQEGADGDDPLPWQKVRWAWIDTPGTSEIKAKAVLAALARPEPAADAAAMWERETKRLRHALVEVYSATDDDAIRAVIGAALEGKLPPRLEPAADEVERLVKNAVIRSVVGNFIDSLAHHPGLLSDKITDGIKAIAPVIAALSARPAVASEEVVETIIRDHVDYTEGGFTDKYGIPDASKRIAASLAPAAPGRQALDILDRTAIRCAVDIVEIAAARGPASSMGHLLDVASRLRALASADTGGAL